MVYSYVTAAGEVGSGTPNAAGGRHFSPLAPKGHKQENNGLLRGILPVSPPVTPPVVGAECVVAGGGIGGVSGGERESVVVVSYKPRGKTGSVSFQEDELTADIHSKLVNPSTIAVLHIVCGSKTGLVYPSLETVGALKMAFGDRVVVVVDACQLRCRLTAVATYTEM